MERAWNNAISEPSRLALIVMRPLHIAIDARLPDAGQGGVLSVIRSMAQAFAQSDNHAIRRSWIVLKQAHWWRSALPAQDEIIEISTPTSAVATRIPSLVSRLAPPLLRVIRDRPHLDSQLKSAGVNVVHLPYQDGILTDLPFVYFPHDLQHRYLPENFTRAQLHHRESRWRRRALLAKYVVAAGEHVKRDLTELWGVPQERVLVYPFPPPVKSSPVKRNVEIHYRPYVIYPAVFWPHKNHHSLIKAMSILKYRGSGLHLVLTGARNSALPATLRLIERLGLTDCVHCLGHVEDSELNELINESAAVVLPSLFEAVSLTAYDAMRSRRPIVCSDREFFRAQCGDKAIYFDPLDPISIADGIQKVFKLDLNNPALGPLSEETTSQLSLELFAKNLCSTYRLCIDNNV